MEYPEIFKYVLIPAKKPIIATVDEIFVYFTHFLLKHKKPLNNMSRPNLCLIPRRHLDGIRSRSVPAGTANGQVQHQPRVVIEERFKNHIRDRSQQMTRNWTNTVEQRSRCQAEERATNSQQQSVDEQRAYEAMRNQQRDEQRAEIERIEASMRRAQPGPKQLDSAALLSDCLHVQRAQRQEMALRNISNRQQVVYEGRLLRLQNHQWAMEQQQRQQEYHLRAIRYKQDLRDMMDERKRQHDIYQQQQQQVCVDYPSQKAIEKERREMERRQIQLRQTATDAMRMAEQRRLREKMVGVVQERLCEMHLEGKARQEELRSQQERRLADEQRQRQDAGQVRVAQCLKEAAQVEQEREAKVLARAAEEYEQQAVDRERAEVERKKKLKAQRIQFHLEEVRAERERKANEEKQSQEAVLNKLSNVDISRAFAREQRDQRVKEANRLRMALQGQWEDKQRVERERKEAVQLFTNRQCDYAADHKDFVSCAKEALQVAEAERRPVQPYVKAIRAYERDNFVEEKPLLPHLQVLKPAVAYERKELPKDNDKEVIRYNIEQLRALNPVVAV